MFNVNVSIAMDPNQLRNILLQQTAFRGMDLPFERSEFFDPEVEEAFQKWWRGDSKEMISVKSTSKVGQFVSGELIFYPTRVELCSVKICDGLESGLRRKILDVLKCKRSNGNFVSLSGDELRDKVDAADVNTVAAAIRKLRKDINKRLGEIGIECGDEDVILSGGPGYRLAETITIREIDQFDMDANLDCAAVRGQSPKPSGKSPELRGAENARQEWVLKELKAGNGLRLSAIIETFDCSARTAKRDLESLRRVHKITFHGSQKTGEYRLGQATAERNFGSS